MKIISWPWGYLDKNTQLISDFPKSLNLEAKIEYESIQDFYTYVPQLNHKNNYNRRQREDPVLEIR